MKLQNHENQITGQWVSKNGKVHADATCARIEWLITNELKKIATDATGWDVLYQDPNDGRYWELTYPESEMHGGGPPKLTLLSNAEAQIKYKISKI